MINTMGAPSIGAMFGTVGTDGLIQQINQDLGRSSYFGSVDDILSKGRQMFVENIVQPIRAIGNSIKNVIGTIENENEIIPITDLDHMKAAPQAMHMPILTYEPVAKLFNQGRIFGWGYEEIPKEDCYGRLVSNGYIEDVASAMDDKGEFDLTWEFRCTDPELDIDQIESIEETRSYIDWLLENTNYDFTDPVLSEDGKFNRRG